MLDFIKNKKGIVRNDLKNNQLQTSLTNSINYKNPICSSNLSFEDQAKEKLRRIKRIIICENFSKKRKDLKNLALYFEQRLIEKKNDLDITLGLGNCFERLEEKESLKKLYESFDNKANGSIKIKRKLADFYYNEKNYSEAIRNYKLCLKSNNDVFKNEIYIKLSSCFYFLKEYKKGVRIVLKCTKKIVFIHLKYYYYLVIYYSKKNISKKQ